MAEPLDELTDAAGYSKLVDKMVKTAVVAARAKGATWQQVGAALGVSHQAARKRFKPICEQAKALANGNHP